jgi:hypothetical protein
MMPKGTFIDFGLGAINERGYDINLWSIELYVGLDIIYSGAKGKSVFQTHNQATVYFIRVYQTQAANMIQGIWRGVSHYRFRVFFGRFAALSSAKIQL